MAGHSLTVPVATVEDWLTDIDRYGQVGGSISTADSLRVAVNGGVFCTYVRRGEESEIESRAQGQNNRSKNEDIEDHDLGTARHDFGIV